MKETPIQYTEKILALKMKKKYMTIFLFLYLPQNIDCGYTSHFEDVLTSTHKVYLSQNEDVCIPLYKQFYCIRPRSYEHFFFDNVSLSQKIMLV